LRETRISGRHRRRNELQRDRLIQREVVSPVPLARAAAPEQRDEPVAAGDNRASANEVVDGVDGPVTAVVSAPVMNGSNVGSFGERVTRRLASGNGDLGIRLPAGYTPSVQLLVSVRDAEEARAALAGGADIVDAKEPGSGALGAVSVDALRAIVAAVGNRRPVTAALGDAANEQAIERDAAAFGAAGATTIKAGFAGIADGRTIEMLLAAARHGTGADVIAVAYADYVGAASANPRDVLEAAARAGAAGILIDTADKAGPGLLDLMSLAALTRLVSQARAEGLLVALAGRLTIDDLLPVRDAGAHVAGVRGAACDGGRLGRIAADRIRLLRRRLQHGIDDRMGGCP
jgi:(5-formylfuran-3-yl)methyl phosphate synthase